MDRVENLKSLCGFVHDIVHEEANGNEDLIGRILDRRKKAAEVTRVREKILRRVRSEIWELHKHDSPKWEVVHSKERPGSNWRPLGYTRIATILGGDHSAWVKMAQAIGVAEKNNKPRVETKSSENAVVTT